LETEADLVTVPFSIQLQIIKVKIHGTLRYLALSACLTAGFLSSVVAQTSVVSQPVGFVTTSCLGDSDTFVSIPFTRPSEFTGAIQSAAGNIITVSGTPGWTSNQFVYAAGVQPKRFYTLIGGGGASNPKEGHIYFVTANGSNTLTVDTTADNLKGITANTQLLVIPYWTPATVFPASDANVSFTPTSSSANYQTQIRVPNYSASGIDLPYSPVYFFSNNVDGTSSNVGWRVVGNNTTDHGDDPLLPDGYFVVRNTNGAPTRPLKGLGAVLTKKVTVPLISSAGQSQDNAVSMIRPIDVALKATGLNPEDGSFAATTAPPLSPRNQDPVLQDQLLLFDNSQVAINKQPSATYYYFVGFSLRNRGWRLVGGTAADRGNDLILAGSAMIVRKAKNTSAQTSFWTNAPTY
jgi:uncharacterized protein (TIGR02597 family)